jgi:ubiquinone/menaquinone biosynthesis C-methylase UbiE
MNNSAPFSSHHKRYDLWFECHPAAWQSELLAIRALQPRQGFGLSIGVGSGRFAAPLGVQIGIDPASEMLAYAEKRGVTTVQAIAEALPFVNDSFDYVLSVTTICFVDNVNTMLQEAKRILQSGGSLILGFIDRETELGQQYLSHQAENVFYRDATFYSAHEIEHLLEKNGFTESCWLQTLFHPLEMTHQIEPLRDGYGQGAFVAVRVRSFD